MQLIQHLIHVRDAKTLSDRGYIYQPNTVKGNKPINIGHSYSLLSILPEKVTENDGAWAVPLSGERVSLKTNGVDIASKQIQVVMSDSSLPWYKKSSVLVSDTAYSKRQFLFEQSQHDNARSDSSMPQQSSFLPISTR